jgi:hypothetical protein
MAVANSWQYRPHESPANIHLTGGAVDAGDTLHAYQVRSPLIVTSSPTEERTLEDLGGPTGSTSLQSGFYAHLGQAGRTSRREPGVESPATPPRLVHSAAPNGGSCGGEIRDQHSLNAAVAMERVIDY